MSLSTFFSGLVPALIVFFAAGISRWWTRHRAAKDLPVQQEHARIASLTADVQQLKKEMEQLKAALVGETTMLGQRYGLVQSVDQLTQTVHSLRQAVDKLKGTPS